LGGGLHFTEKMFNYENLVYKDTVFDAWYLTFVKTMMFSKESNIILFINCNIIARGKKNNI